MKGKENCVSDKVNGKDFLLTNNYAEASVFKPKNLVETAIKQKGLRKEKVPPVCILDPDGDIVRYLLKSRQATKSGNWPCYHTDMYLFERDGIDFGIIGCAVGSSFAVLLAEELFTLGCELLISITSAGLIDTTIKTPTFMLIERAIRDEGTSYHYISKSESAELSPALKINLKELTQNGRLIKGIAWTTDAPFRETQSKVNHMKNLGVIAVEMESSALYSFAKAKKKNVVCFAYITNRMGRGENDFDKGNENGSEEALKLIIEVTKLVEPVGGKNES